MLRLKTHTPDDLFAKFAVQEHDHSRELDQALSLYRKLEKVTFTPERREALCQALAQSTIDRVRILDGELFSLNQLHRFVGARIPFTSNFFSENSHIAFAKALRDLTEDDELFVESLQNKDVQKSYQKSLPLTEASLRALEPTNRTSRMRKL